MRTVLLLVLCLYSAAATTTRSEPGRHMSLPQRQLLVLP
jgi:hypothetical protein